MLERILKFSVQHRLLVGSREGGERGEKKSGTYRLHNGFLWLPGIPSRGRR